MMIVVHALAVIQVILKMLIKIVKVCVLVMLILMDVVLVLEVQQERNLVHWIVWEY
jgi:hypothetical protein